MGAFKTYEVKPVRSFWQLRAFLKPYRWHMVAVILATVGVTGLNLLGPWIIREVTAVVRTQSLSGLIPWAENITSHLLWLTLIFAGTQIIRGGFQFITSYVAHVMAWRYVSDVRVGLYHHLQKLSLRFYHDKQTGEVMSRLVNTTS